LAKVKDPAITNFIDQRIRSRMTEAASRISRGRTNAAGKEGTINKANKKIQA